MHKVMLGGLPIDLHAGAVDQQYGSEGGVTRHRLSDGTLVQQTHWRKETISLSGTGWMGPGLDGLDYSGPLELRCTAPKAISAAGTVITLTGAPRPDVPPWAHALVGRRWVATPVTLTGSAATVTPVAGASQYRVSWMPQFNVICDPPPVALSAGNASFSWNFTAQEI
jgi:hypothetical protein